MNLTTRLKRASIGALAALLVFGAGAFAQTSSVDLTVGVVEGTRTLAVTGVDSGTNAPAPSSAVALSFNETSTTGKLGLTVTDVLFDDIGYSVAATLSDLYKIDPSETNGFACSATNTIVPSGALTAGFSNLLAPTDAVAVVEPLLTFTGDASTVNSLIGTVTSTLDGLYQEVPTTELLMHVGNGAGGTFDRPAAHPVCGGATTDPSGPSDVVLQTGTPNDTTVNLGSIAADLWSDALTAAGSTDSSLTVAEAITAGLLEPSADDPGGRLYEDVEATLLGITGLAVTDQLVRDVIAVLSATAPTLDISDLVAQSGIYQNVPEFTFVPANAPNATTGLYQGRMTITLTSN